MQDKVYEGKTVEKMLQNQTAATDDPTEFVTTLAKKFREENQKWKKFRQKLPQVPEGADALLARFFRFQEGKTAIVYALAVQVLYLGMGPYTTANSDPEKWLEIFSLGLAMVEFIILEVCFRVYNRGVQAEAWNQELDQHQELQEKLDKEDEKMQPLMITLEEIAKAMKSC